MGMAARPEGTSSGSNDSGGAAAAEVAGRAGAATTAAAAAAAVPAGTTTVRRSRDRRSGRDRNLSATTRAQIRSKIAMGKISSVRQDDWRGVLRKLDEAELEEGRVVNNNSNSKKRAGVSTFVYNKCISRMAKCFRWGEALDILTRMAELGVMPNS